jgi:hypothetical protein
MNSFIFWSPMRRSVGWKNHDLLKAWLHVWRIFLKEVPVDHVESYGAIGEAKSVSGRNQHHAFIGQKGVSIPVVEGSSEVVVGALGPQAPQQNQGQEQEATRLTRVSSSKSTSLRR